MGNIPSRPAIVERLTKDDSVKQPREDKLALLLSETLSPVLPSVLIDVVNGYAIRPPFRGERLSSFSDIRSFQSVRMCVCLGSALSKISNGGGDSGSGSGANSSGSEGRDRGEDLEDDQVVYAMLASSEIRIRSVSQPAVMRSISLSAIKRHRAKKHNEIAELCSLGDVLIVIGTAGGSLRFLDLRQSEVRDMERYHMICIDDYEYGGGDDDEDSEGEANEDEQAIQVLRVLQDGRLAGLCGDGIWIWTGNWVISDDNANGSSTGDEEKGFHLNDLSSLNAISAIGSDSGLLQDWWQSPSSSNSSSSGWRQNGLQVVCEAVLKGHRGSVFALTQLRDGRLVSGGHDRMIKVWRLDEASGILTGECERTLQGHESVLFFVMEMQDGILASGSDDQSVCVWSINQGTCLYRLSFESTLYSLFYYGHGQLFIGASNGAMVFDMMDGSQHQLPSQIECPTAIASLSDGKVVMAGADETGERIWLEVWQ